MGGKIRKLFLDVFGLRCLVANKMNVSSRQLDVSESGIDGRGLGWRDKV